MIEDITPSEFAKRRDSVGGDHWQLVDVREPWELDIVAAPDALAIPMAEVPARIAELDRNRPLAVLCRSGGRSRQIAEFLALQGFTDIVNIAGGINAWATELDEQMQTY